MSYLGQAPSNAIITSSQLADGIVTNPKLASNAVTDVKVAADTLLNRAVNSASSISLFSSGNFNGQKKPIKDKQNYILD